MLLAWASFALAQPASAPAPARPWQQSPQTDLAQTYTFTRFTLVGRFVSSPGEQSADRPALTVDCIPGTGSHPKGRYLSASLLVGPKLKIVYVEPEEIHGTSYYPKVDVRYRTDDVSEASRDQWSAGSDKASAAVPKDALQKILRARTFVVTVADEHGSQLAMRFDMPDATPVEAACNVDER